MTDEPKKGQPPVPGEEPLFGTRGSHPNLFAKVSHELRTPMNAILGYAQLLAETPLDETQQTFLDAIEHSARGLLDLLDDILNLSRLDAGKLEIHNQPFALRDCLDSVLEMLAASAYRKGLDFIRIVDHDVPVNLIGDPLRLRQILVNLIGNAIKFTPAGAVRLRVSVTPEQQRHELNISVIDSGIGIDQDAIGQLFEPFSRPATGDPEIGGTGLGLVISRSLSEALGGSIAVRSVPGTGSTFTLRLPLESAEAPSRSRDDSILLRDTRVAIVCADAEFGEWIAEVLNHAGAGTRLFGSVSRLNELIDSGQSDADIALIFVGATDLQNLDAVGARWRPARGKLPGLVLASAGSQSALRQVEEVFGCPAMPAHLPAASIVRRIAAARSTAPTAQAVVPTTVRQPLKDLRLLVADDNLFGRTYLTMLLERNGASVDSCIDGEQACTMIAEGRYDLVLMDIRMPGVDGVEAMKSIRNLPACPPVIGLTGAPEESCRALAAGMTDCLLKPIRPAVLLDYIVSHHVAGGIVDDIPGYADFMDEEMRGELNRELPLRIAELDEAIARGDMTLALDAAHKINGTAAICGFAALRAIAASVEGSIRQHDLEGIAGLTHRLKQEVDRVIASLDTR